MDAAAVELPTKTPAEILQHEQWYVEFCALLESKKAAIEAWREEKQVRCTVIVGRWGFNRLCVPKSEKEAYENIAHCYEAIYQTRSVRKGERSKVFKAGSLESQLASPLHLWK